MLQHWYHCFNCLQIYCIITTLKQESMKSKISIIDPRTALNLGNACPEFMTEPILAQDLILDSPKIRLV